MPDIRIETDARDVITSLNGAQGAIRKHVTADLRALGKELQRVVQQTLPKRSGRARRSIFTRIDRRRVQGDVAVLVGANLAKAPHMKTLELGAQIIPKRGQYLAIPFGAALRRTGVAKFSAAALRDDPAALGFESSFVRGDTVFGVRRGRPVGLFHLTKHVLITRRRYLHRTAQTYRRGAEARMRVAIRDALAEVARGA